MYTGARLTGLITFIVGMVLLAVAFAAAYALFHGARTAPVPSDYKVITADVVRILAQGVFLFVMGYIGSLVAGRGIQMFEAGAPPPAENSKESVKP